MADLSWSLRTAPEAALKFFRGKGLQTSFSWKDMWQEEHDTAFTVAKMMDLDLLRDVRDAVDNAIASGQTFADFRKQLEPELVKRGWWGRAEMVDPLTNEKKNVQLGSVRRLETIFHVNTQMAYAAGTQQRIDETADEAPWLMYDAVDDNHTRPQHRAWDGTTLRHDDPWWQTHTPPNGWKCRCFRIQLSGNDLKQLGKTPDKQAPPVVMREYTNTRSGEITRVPAGVDPGFGYQPGASSRRAEAVALFADRVAAVPAPIGAAAWQSIMKTQPAIVHAHDRAWSRFVDESTAGRKPQRAWFTLGAMAPEDVSFLAARGVEPASAEISAEDRLIVGAKARRHVDAGDALSINEMKTLPRIVRSPDAVLYDIQNETLLYVAAGTKNTKLVVRPDYVVGKKKQQLNAVRSAFKVQQDALLDRNQFLLVRGSLK